MMDTILLLQAFNRFSEFCVFKLKKCYAIGLCFILLRKNIQPYNDDTKTAVKLYKCSDKTTIFGTDTPLLTSDILTSSAGSV